MLLAAGAPCQTSAAGAVRGGSWAGRRGAPGRTSSAAVNPA